MIQAHITSFGLGGQKSGGFFGSVKRVFALIAAFGVGALVLVAAGVLAIATAIVGVIIAFVAMLLRMGAWKRPATQPHAERSTEAGSETILNARRTARGWTVDG
ncbi:MAG: hypothetical protein CMK09_11320 [Ponticaulis sp.]|nr:hypothetical protein [Ponticaulis sp.]|tara:strand:- start:37851 stop:38162 length:312 start_codon:yes stop_codon:yes gene_type:complete